MPGCRLLLAFFALVALTLPACLHVDARIGPRPAAQPERSTEPAPKAKADTAQTTSHPQAPQMQFAVLPKAPGTVVPTNPDAPPTVSTNTSQKPTKPDVPPPPAAPAPGILKADSSEPAKFPALTQFGVPEAPLLAAVRAYSEGRPDQAIEVIRKMDKSQQDFVLTVLPILARGATADLASDPATAAALTDQLRAAAARLEPLAALKIEKIAFCSDVAGFGRFVQRPIANPYRPNERVQLYFELRNLGNQYTPDGFLTHVQAVVEIRDAENKLVAQIDPEEHRKVPTVKFEKRLVTRSPLQDFHVLYIFSAPPGPGVYTVTVQFRDATGRRTVTSQPAEFRVAGP